MRVYLFCTRFHRYCIIKIIGDNLQYFEVIWPLQGQYCQYAYNQIRSMNDQQLLDGVAMTNSISCEANELAQDYQLSQSSEQHEGQSRQRYLREVSFDSSARPQTSRRLAETVKAYQLKEPSKSEIKFHSGKTNKNANRQWKILMGLDDKLFEVHFLGFLENNRDMMSKIGQIIVIQEYTRLKIYERELEEAIKVIQQGLKEYEKQKKALQSQIQHLKDQNDILYKTIIELYSVVESLQKEINNNFDNSLDPYISIDPKKQHSIQVPFARTFSHSLEEIKTLKQTHSYSQSITSNDLAALLSGLLKASEDMVLGKSNHSLTQLKAKLPFLRDYHFLHFLTLIEENIKAAALKIKNNHLKTYENFPINQGSHKTILQSFLNSLSNNRQILLKNSAGHLEPNLYLLHIVSSSVITFLGILCEQSKHYTLQMSFGNNTRSWVASFLQEIRILIKETKIKLKRSEEDYLCCLYQFVSDVSELAALRMWSKL